MNHPHADPDFLARHLRPAFAGSPSDGSYREDGVYRTAQPTMGGLFGLTLRRAAYGQCPSGSTLGSPLEWTRPCRMICGVPGMVHPMSSRAFPTPFGRAWLVSGLTPASSSLAVSRPYTLPVARRERAATPACGVEPECRRQGATFIVRVTYVVMLPWAHLTCVVNLCY